MCQGLGKLWGMLCSLCHGDRLLQLRGVMPCMVQGDGPHVCWMFSGWGH